MAVVVDSTMLLLMVDPDARSTRVPHGRERIDHLLQRLSQERVRILIPAPALAEILVRQGPGAAEFLDILQKSRWLRVAPFDERAAIECAALLTENFSRRRRTKSGGSRHELKFDQQILAIARVAQASCIYTDDRRLRQQATLLQIDTNSLADLPLPPDSRQVKMELE